MPKSFNKDMKELVGNLITYFEKERDAGGPLLPLTAVRERVANALNISLTTVSRVSQELNSGEGFNASYHSSLEDKTPNSGWTKANITP